MPTKITVDELSILDAVKALNDLAMDAYSSSIRGTIIVMKGKVFSAKKLVRLLKKMENRGFVSSRLAVGQSGTRKRLFKVLKGVPL